MRRLFLFLSLFALVKGFAIHLTTDPKIIWDTTCNSCKPPADCNAPCFNPGLNPRLNPSLNPTSPSEEVTLDLVNPLYEDGVISTEEGGVLIGNCLRIQAQKIVYTRQLDKAPSQFTVYCEGNLIVDYNDRVLTGETLFYDFITHTGKITCGKTAAFPWFVGGDEILLCENGDVVVNGGYITTSEGGEKDVVLMASQIKLSRCLIAAASDVTFRIKNIPFFWIPKAHLDLKRTKDSPVSFNVGWDGFLGTHAGIKYHFLTLGDFKGYLRADGYVGKGFGVGFESEYDPKCIPTEFYTRNYYANDLAIDDPHKKNRYRFQGTFYHRFYENCTSCELLYDVVSDAQMAADYAMRDFDLNPAQRTEFTLRKETPFWIANLFARLRVNRFQTINQQLPSFEMTLHPFEVFETGIFAENLFRISFQDYVFSNDIRPRQDFHSGRFEVRPRIYRPIPLEWLTITPEARFIGIAYSNSPSHQVVGQAVADLAVTCDSSLSRFFGRGKHIVHPYAEYHFLSAPKAPLDNHYIFTIEDAYERLNLVRFGMRHLFYFPPSRFCISPLRIDLWANAFIDTKTIPQPIQKGYLQADWQPHPRLFLELNSGWNFQERQLDYINTRSEWTLSENAAFAFEWRHRSRFAWRKNDFYNFLLEAVRNQDRLLASPLSDRRDTLLSRLFYRITPNLGARVEVRHGWNRIKEPRYTEYLLGLETVIFQHWRLDFIYEKRTEDHRYAIALRLDPARRAFRKGL